MYKLHNTSIQNPAEAVSRPAPWIDVDFPFEVFHPEQLEVSQKEEQKWDQKNGGGGDGDGKLDTNVEQVASNAILSQSL
jgi:hypothetical protein